MAEDAANRTEEPTPKRREEARADGRIPQSAEITAATVLLAALLAAWRSGDAAIGSLREAMRRSLVAVSKLDLTPAQLGDVLHGMLQDVAAVVVPILAATAVAGVAATVAQIGFQLHGKRLLPDPSKVSPASGFQRIFSSKGLFDLAKAIVKIALIGWLAWKLIRAAEGTIVALSGAAPREMLSIAGLEVARLVGWATAILVVLAAADYAWQRRQHHQSLRMTRSEVKDEVRQAEGDPKIKGRLRRAYQEIAKARSVADVPTADVVITNPVHLAVALKYLPGQMGAPKVVAKGAEGMAQRIKEVARQHGVPIMERRSLARALFRSVPVGGEIPATLYRAIAEILAYVYGLRQRRAAGGGVG
ncbi:MAG: flagellar biosynthesis protein FlhB [Deltaproteobacteria bacterium]|nr:flagellar biosynthesis protein FlhB [Deltaproteobacteria bacterium]